MLAHHRRPVPWTGTLGWIWLGSGFSWSTEAIEELFLQIAPVPVLLTSAVGDKWVLLSEFGSVHAPSSISLSVPSQRSCAKAALLLGDVYVCDYNTMIWSNTTMYGVFCHIVLMSWHMKLIEIGWSEPTIFLHWCRVLTDTGRFEWWVRVLGFLMAKTSIWPTNIQNNGQWGKCNALFREWPWRRIVVSLSSFLLYSCRCWS